MSEEHRIYLVDDHPLVREWLTTLIQQQPDLTVCGEADGAPAALEGIGRLKPDVVIVDLTLESGSGLELVKDVRSVCEDSVCLVLSMHDELTYAERALRAGARGYVCKRDSTRQIVEAIRAVIAGEIFLSHEMRGMMTEKWVGGRAESGAGVGQLSDRELEVFRMLGQGRETKEIAASLSLSIKTVQVYCARIKEKFQLASHTELLREAVRWNDARTGGAGTERS